MGSPAIQRLMGTVGSSQFRGSPLHFFFAVVEQSGSGKAIKYEQLKFDGQAEPVAPGLSSAGLSNWC